MLDNNNYISEWITCSGYLTDLYNKPCAKNLFKLRYIDGVSIVEIKCPRCKTINEIVIEGHIE